MREDMPTAAEKYRAMFGEDPPGTPKTQTPRSLTEKERSIARVGLGGFIPGVDQPLIDSGIDWATTFGSSDSTVAGLKNNNNGPKLNDIVESLKYNITYSGYIPTKEEQRLLGSWWSSFEKNTESIPSAKKRLSDEIRQTPKELLGDNQATLVDLNDAIKAGDERLNNPAARYSLEDMTAKQDTLQTMTNNAQLLGFKDLYGPEGYATYLQDLGDIMNGYYMRLESLGKEEADKWIASETGGNNINWVNERINALKYPGR